MKSAKRTSRRLTAVVLLVTLVLGLAAPALEAGVADSINRGLNKMGQGIRKGVNWMNGVVDKGRNLIIGTASIGGGLIGALGGAVIGGLCLGPVGLIGGAIGGYFLGKCMTGALLRSSLPMIGGAIAGAVLTAGMGIPAMLCGAFIGGTIGRFLAKGLVGNDRLFSKSAENPQDVRAAQYLKQAGATSGQQPQPTSSEGQVMLRQATPQVSSSAEAHAAYQEAYRKYAEATQKGDAAEAQKWLAVYQDAAKALKSGSAR